MPNTEPPAGFKITPEMVTLEAMEQVIEMSPFTKWSGTTVTAISPGYAASRTPYKKELTQHHGFIHGGVVGFMSDNISAWAAATAVGDVLSAEFNVKFLAPGKGDYFTAEGNVVKASRRLVVVESKVFAHTETEKGEDKKLIAIGSATILPKS